MTIERIDALYVYPVKSMAGVSAQRLQVGRRGPDGDRRWMVTDPNGRFVTGRLLPSLVRCTAQLRPDGVTLTMDGHSIDVAMPAADADAVSVLIWRDHCHALDAGEAAAEWLAARFGRPLRLVYQGNHQHRPLPPEKSQAPGDEVSFADGYPLLLIGTASLSELNTRLQTPVTMAHFRPNIVVKTSRAFAEDDWTHVRVGDMQFVVASMCARCIFTTVDPHTGERRDDGEPLASLRSYRRDAESGNILFGVNLIPVGEGVLDKTMPVHATAGRAQRPRSGD